MSSANGFHRRQVQSWLEKHWDSKNRRPRDGSSLTQWREKVFKHGWSAPGWPKQWWGMGLDKTQTAIVVSEFACAGAPGAGLADKHIVANTIMKFGSDELKRSIIPEYLVEDSPQCLLYSEPCAGSDLASLRTRAVRKGDKYIFNGQKTWTSGAGLAKYALLIARTDWEAPKHGGLTFFLIEMRQPGIVVRPIRQITGESRFNEVFLDNAEAPVAYRLGAEGEGWQVLQSALVLERLVMGSGTTSWQTAECTPYLISLARETARLNDPIMRQRIAQALAWRDLNTLNIARAKAEITSGQSAHLMSMVKLMMSRILHNDARVARTLLGATSMLDGDASPRAADANYRAANAYMTSIGGGTDQIQRNIISERVIGLPREIEPDRSVPFGSSASIVRSQT